MALETGLFYEPAEGEALDVRRDRDSRLNRNAVFLARGNQRLGYLQADAARAIGPELDAGLEGAAVIVETRMPAGGVSEVIVEVRAL